MLWLLWHTPHLPFNKEKKEESWSYLKRQIYFWNEFHFSKYWFINFCFFLKLTESSPNWVKTWIKSFKKIILISFRVIIYIYFLVYHFLSNCVMCYLIVLSLKSPRFIWRIFLVYIGLSLLASNCEDRICYWHTN